jgi:hypothetical protein
LHLRASHGPRNLPGFNGPQIGSVLDLVQELAAALMRERIDYVVGDAVEGYNPSHDLCRAIINAAVDIASHERDRDIPNFEVLLTSEPEDAAARPEGTAGHYENVLRYRQHVLPVVQALQGFAEPVRSRAACANKLQAIRFSLALAITVSYWQFLPGL